MLISSYIWLVLAQLCLTVYASGAEGPKCRKVVKTSSWSAWTTPSATPSTTISNTASTTPWTSTSKTSSTKTSSTTTSAPAQPTSCSANQNNVCDGGSCFCALKLDRSSTCWYLIQCPASNECATDSQCTSEFGADYKCVFDDQDYCSGKTACVYGADLCPAGANAKRALEIVFENARRAALSQ